MPSFPPPVPVVDAAASGVFPVLKAETEPPTRNSGPLLGLPAARGLTVTTSVPAPAATPTPTPTPTPPVASAVDSVGKALLGAATGPQETPKGGWGGESSGTSGLVLGPENLVAHDWKYNHDHFMSMVPAEKPGDRCVTCVSMPCCFTPLWVGGNSGVLRA